MQNPTWLFITDLWRNPELGAAMRKDFVEVSNVCEALDPRESRRGKEEVGTSDDQFYRISCVS